MNIKQTVRIKEVAEPDRQDLIGQQGEVVAIYLEQDYAVQFDSEVAGDIVVFQLEELELV